MPTTGLPLRQDPQVRQAIRDLSPGLLAMAAWGLVTGLAMVESGLSTGQAVGMSLLVYAGAAQLASLPLLASGAPVLLIWASALVINLRFLIYAVGQQAWMSRLSRLQRLLHGYFTTDILAVFAAQRAGDGWGSEALIRYFRTGAVLNWVVWQTASLTGIFLAASLPREAGLKVLPALAILALLLPMIRSRPALACVLVSGLVALLLRHLPLNLGLFLATLAGVSSAVWFQRRRSSMSDFWTWIALVGLGLTTLLSRSGPLWSARPLQLTETQRFALQMAPMAALAAILAPAFLLTEGGDVSLSAADPRLWALMAAVTARLLGRGLLTILVSGLFAYGVARFILAS